MRVGARPAPVRSSRSARSTNSTFPGRIAKRGGPKAVSDLEDRAGALRQVAKATTGRRGTEEEGEK